MDAHFDNSYARLGDKYSTAVTPTPSADPSWIAFNDALADELDWPVAWRQTELALEALAGNGILPGSEPRAAVYAGHQFGSYNPQLGDGRALLLGEWLSSGGNRWDIQLKGAGRTPFSRGGDGRSPMGPVVREYVMSEAMHALGVPTTRALAAVATGEPVMRNQLEPGAILTRVASSHLRVGTVQYFAMTQRGDGLEALVEHVLARHYPNAQAEQPDLTPAALLLDAVARKLAALAARWQGLGFIHGVLNTDNTLLSGETIDYGPCAFMDTYNEAQVFSAIDTQGRYAFRNQPGILHWNLSVLAQCLLPLIDGDDDKALAYAQSVVDAFPQQFTDAYAGVMAAKLGLDGLRDNDKSLVDGFFTALTQDALDYTLAFRWLTEIACDSADHSPIHALFSPGPALKDWLEAWRKRRGAGSEAAAQRMCVSNPVVIPRNHLVARAIAAAERGDYAEMASLNARCQAPWEWRAGDEQWAAMPSIDEKVTRTFCGT